MMKAIDYTLLPEHMRDGMRAWIETPHHPKLLGSFMYATLTNDLMGAFRNADHVNLVSMHLWVMFLHNQAPSGCYGSAEKLDEWHKAGGLAGFMGLAGEPAQ